MELIKDSGTRLIKGYWLRFGIFLCPYCNKEVERRLAHGLKQKSCGCVKNKLISESVKGKKKTEEHKNKLSKIRIEKELSKGKNNPNYGNGIKTTGENHWNWQDGKSFEEYSQDFFDIRKQILERDNYICQCPDCEHKTELLDIHHIDYNKQNNIPKNLITLCRSCHAKTFCKNSKNYYKIFYQNIMKSKLCL
mgnify:CR=1 FL=1